jgi:serine/threonine protein kinase
MTDTLDSISFILAFHRLHLAGHSMLAPSASDVEPELLEAQLRISQTLSAPRLPGYEVLGLIGAGRYGIVWRAVETQTQAVVAIKRLRQQPVGRTRDESDKLAQLSSARGIVALRKLYLDEEPYCYVMEHMYGGTLAEEMRAGPLPPARAWDIFKQLTAALAYVHKDAIVHCDLKPANILLDTRGQPRIGDFGQARGLGPGGSSLGTRFYMPPEQAQETEPDTRWDVYALGAIYYEMLTGQRPRYDERLDKRFGTSTGSGTEVRKHLEAYARHLEDCPPPAAHRLVAGVDVSVARLIDRCMAVDFDARPKDAAAVEQLINDCERDARLRKLNRFGFLLPAIMLLIVGLVALFAGA